VGDAITLENGKHSFTTKKKAGVGLPNGKGNEEVNERRMGPRHKKKKAGGRRNAFKGGEKAGRSGETVDGQDDSGPS